MPIRSQFVAPAVAAGEAPRRTIVLDITIEPWLFAGGAVPRRHDPIAALRPTSVLGQVRFFWRLLRPVAECEPLKQIKEAEARSFGGASRPAPFSIAVRAGASGRKVDVPKIGQPGGYVTFSGREEPPRAGRPGTPQAELSEGVTATVTFTFAAEPDPSVRAAIRAWALLGGVGGRTRRGLGAVQVAGGPPTTAALEAALRQLVPAGTADAKGGGGMRSIREIWIGTGQPTARACLDKLDKWYREYRQDRRPGRPRPGRSFWDEPELIRVLTGQRAKKHAPLANPPGRHAPGWARGVLGLPIVFKFKDDPDGDPQQTQQQGAPGGADTYDRMASPILFRPVRVGATYAPVVVLLSAPYVPPGGFGLKVGGRLQAIPATPGVDQVFADLFTKGVHDLGLRRVV